jgi:hypothetical protein
MDGRVIAFGLALLAAAMPALAGDRCMTWHGTGWGESSEELARQFGGRAVVLKPPIEFGDSYADIALRDEPLGGYRFTVYFQMDRASRGLKRIQFERQRHGANARIFAATVGALAAEYGPPTKLCASDPRRANGYQGSIERLWVLDGMVIRASFRDTTLEASEGCPIGSPPGIGACGLTAHLFVQITPPSAGAEACR